MMVVASATQQWRWPMVQPTGGRIGELASLAWPTTSGLAGTAGNATPCQPSSLGSSLSGAAPFFLSGRCGLLLGASLLLPLAGSRRRAGRRSLIPRPVSTVEVESAATQVGVAHEAQGRPAHWVIRTTDLQRSLDFLTEVFGMHVLRHEEMDVGCKISCNGNFKNPWSKTMVGYRREDQGYCLELTYTYGVDKYSLGSGLAYIAVGVEDVDMVLEKAASLGYTVEGDSIMGPEGYKFRVVPQPAGRTERFQYVALKVRGWPRAEEFYKGALGMADLTVDSPLSAVENDVGLVRVLGYGGDEEVPLVVLEDPKSPFFKLQTWEGRNALAIPSRALNDAYRRVVEAKPGGSRVLHKLQRDPLITDKNMSMFWKSSGSPPDLEIAILVAPEGFEVCIVSSETFDLSVAAAYNPEVEIDWAWREQRSRDVLARMAEKKANAPRK
mmetsp:Transcript_142331/g.354697  ORF Transcript_142331/g.354697 Transcript_142331/m.354697 type:complete len:440 (-) Transcript_142331:524-1843(-)